MNNNRSRKSGKGKRATSKQHQGDGLLGVGEYPSRASASMQLVIWRNPGRLDPFPQRWRTVVTTAIRGNVPAGTGAQLYYVRMSSVYLPFAGGTWTGALPAIATLNPTGHSNICNQTFYQNFRVLSSRISVSFAPVADIDIMVCTVTPSMSGSNPASTQVAVGQQFCKSKIIQRGQPRRDSTLTNKIALHTLLGVSKQAVLDDLSGRYTGTYATYPTLPAYWVLNFVREDGAVTNSALGYTVTLEHEVEYWGDSIAANLSTISEPTSKELLTAYAAAKLRELN